MTNRKRTSLRLDHAVLKERTLLAVEQEGIQAII